MDNTVQLLYSLFLRPHSTSWLSSWLWCREGEEDKPWDNRNSLVGAHQHPPSSIKDTILSNIWSEILTVPVRVVRLKGRLTGGVMSSSKAGWTKDSIALATPRHRKTIVKLAVNFIFSLLMIVVWSLSLSLPTWNTEEASEIPSQIQSRETPAELYYTLCTLPEATLRNQQSEKLKEV